MFTLCIRTRLGFVHVYGFVKSYTN